ncbi:MAG: TetR/AcrR family transcriptional regulator [Clostridiales bacterium]|jgi:AcrR family transcriptional regulator|nr:TetR/AcrR family transcriptional regulator [Clostridiales bacterium]
MYKKQINASTAKSRQAIADSLVELIQTKGFQHATVTDICKGAALVRKTFYRNFKTKEDVIVYILENVFKAFILDRNVEKMTVEEILSDAYSFIDANRDFLVLFYKNDLFRFAKKNVADFIVKERLYKAVNSEIIDEKYLKYITAQIAALIVSVIETWIEGGFSETPRELARLTEDIMRGRVYADT